MTTTTLATRTDNPLLGPVLDRVAELVDYTHISVYVREGDDVTLLAYRGPVSLHEASHFSFPLVRAGGARRVILEGEPLLIADARGGTEIARSFMEATQDVPAETFDYIGSWIGLPLAIDGRVAGMLDLAHSERNHYTCTDMERVLAFVRQAAVQIEDGVRYGDLVQRAQELRTLYEVQQAINRHLDLALILQLVADQARSLTSAGQALVFLVEGEDLVLAALAGEIPPEMPSGFRLPIASSAIGRVVQSGTVWRTFDAQQGEAAVGDVCRLLGAHSLVIAPLGLPNGPAGALVAANKVYGAFGPRDERVLRLLAGSAAIAVERSRWVRQAAEMDRLQERQRIAQTLHDTVAQKLFRIGLEVEWCRKHVPEGEELAQHVEAVRRMVARAGHELRSAIYALRDAGGMEESSLVALLRNQVDEFQAESGIRATLFVSPDLAPPPSEESELLFRIAREALTNARKHSQAATVVVSLRDEGGGLVLTVQDDGVGLDDSAVIDPAARGLHFGLSTMRQLAAQMGARIHIGSNDDHGTLVQVHLPAAGHVSHRANAPGRS